MWAIQCFQLIGTVDCPLVVSDSHAHTDDQRDPVDPQRCVPSAPWKCVLVFPYISVDSKTAVQDPKRVIQCLEREVGTT